MYIDQNVIMSILLVSHYLPLLIYVAHLFFMNIPLPSLYRMWSL